MSTGYGNSTTGLGVAAQVALASPLNNPPGSGQTKPGGFQELSLSQTSPDSSGYQINCQVQDVAGNEIDGTVLTLTSVANHSGTSPATTVYTGTITGGGSDAFVGFVFKIAGFGHPVNNGSFQVVASSTTTLTLANPWGIAETTAATASEEVNQALEYNILYGTGVVSVTTDGWVQGLTVGHACVEVSYPFAANTLGNAPNGWPYEKIYREINFKVIN
jgi:hypothetical protein